MKRNVAYKKRIFAVTLVCILLLSGCGRSKRDRLEEDLSNVDTEISSGSDADALDVPVQCNYTLTSASGNTKINVDAEVIADGYGNLSVYEQTPVTIDDVYLKHLAESIFDDGVYERVKPYGICSLEELQTEDRFLQELYEEAGEEYPSWKIGTYIENYDEKNVQEMPEGTLIMHSEEYVDGEIVSTDSCTLRGYVDGEIAELAYYNYNYQEEHYKNLELCNIVRRGTVYTSCSTEYELVPTLYGENQCNLENATYTVQDIMQRMGYTDMKLISTEHLVMNGDTADTLYMDGYNFTFVPQTEGIDHLLCNQTYAVVKDKYEINTMLNELPGAGQEWICIGIDSAGIRGINFAIRYDRGERLSEETSTLSFSQVDEVAQDYMNCVLEAWDASGAVTEINIVEVRLGYMTLLYDDQYTLVPVWMYVEEKAVERDVLNNALFAVNALDGSIVQFTHDNESGQPGPWYY